MPYTSKHGGQGRAPSTLTVEKGGTLVALEGTRKCHHGDPVGDQLGPVVPQPVLQLADAVLKLAIHSTAALGALVPVCGTPGEAQTVGAVLVTGAHNGGFPAAELFRTLGCSSGLSRGGCHF